MNCLMLRNTVIYIFFFISKEVCSCIFPFNESCSNRKTENFLMEKDEPQEFSAIIDMFKCALCASTSYTKSIFNNFVKKTNMIFNPGNTYRYKPPPSLFETVAVWTGAINENSDNETWISQKLFMLASTLIFSMLLLDFGLNWLAKSSRTAGLRKFRICINPKEVVMSRISSSLSLATCKSELDD